MTPQHYPLYAVHAKTRKVYLVVGWSATITGAGQVPFLAPVGDKGSCAVPSVEEFRELTYSAGDPSLPSVLDETVVMRDLAR